MKFFVVSVLVLAVVALAQSKSFQGPIEEALAENSVRVQQATEYVASQLGVDMENVATEGFQVPMLHRSCTNQACREICNMLGFLNGVCTSATTCYCSN